MSEERFWLVHSVIRDHPLREGIAAVQAFLSSSPDIIIFDSHSFLRDVGEWDDATHQEYKDILVESFGRWLVRPDEDADGGWGMTVEEMYGQEGLPVGEGRVVLMYEVRLKDIGWERFQLLQCDC